MANNQLLEALDLSRPELTEVKAAFDKGDTAAALKALTKHFRTRNTPKWFTDPAVPLKSVTNEEKSAADLALQNTYNSVNIPYTFTSGIDWAYNPTTQPNSGLAVNNEWTWQFNRHEAWIAIARCHSVTGDAKYASKLVPQIVDWIAKNPPPLDKANNQPLSRWRTLEAGIRMLSAWPKVYHLLVRRPEVFADDALLTMVESMAAHGTYLDAFPSSGNWLIFEMTGLFTVGVLFPEFKNAQKWRQNAIDRLLQEIQGQFYPDGTQFELSPMYHNAVLSNFRGVLDLARLNNIPLSSDFEIGMEKMYDVLMGTITPDGDIPYLNDSFTLEVRRYLTEGLKSFPKRQDWSYIASEGKQGTPPTQTSYLFPYAGWAVMRSGWDKNARYLIFDGGPFGYGHQHEDKLSFILSAWGSRLVFDPGTYPYDESDMRRFVLSARSHSVVHVDGLEQYRQGMPRTTYIAKAPAPLTWKTDANYDYAAASFGREIEEGWGPERKKHVVHTRRILFVKPDYWIVSDTLAANDNLEHSYDSTFQIQVPDVTVDDATRSVFTKNTAGGNLGILPLNSPGLTVRIIKGQEKPFLWGWLPKGRNQIGATPIPTVCFTQKGTGAVNFLYVFAPGPVGQPLPVKAVKPAVVDGAVIAADILLASGDIHQFALMQDGDVVLTGNGDVDFNL